MKSSIVSFSNSNSKKCISSTSIEGSEKHLNVNDDSISDSNIFLKLKKKNKNAKGIENEYMPSPWLFLANGAQSMLNNGRDGIQHSQKIFRYISVFGVQAKNLMRQLPLLERAGIGAIAGGLAGGFTNATLHPIDTVKTKLQSKGASNLYDGPLDVIKKVFLSQGIGGFYRGLPTAFFGSVMSSSLYFGTYEIGKGLLSQSFPPPFPSPLIPPLAAAIGNLTSSAILVPKEVIKQRMQLGVSSSAFHIIVSTLETEGLKGLYAGYSAALWRNLPTNMLNFSTFEYMKAAWLKLSGESNLQPWQSFLSGAMAGALSSSLTTPLDVAKTRLMTQAKAEILSSGASGIKAEVAAKAKLMSSYNYKGVSSTLYRIWKEEGMVGLSRGMETRVLYSTCFSALGFLSFEMSRTFLIKLYLQQQQERKNQCKEEATA